MRLILALCLLAVPALAQPRPGDVFRVDPSALAAPHETPSTANPADVVARPEGTGLQVPPGWRATLFAEKLSHPRNLLVLPDGSLVVAEQRADKLTRLVDQDGDGRADKRETLAEGFDEPFGLAWHDGGLLVGDLKGVWRLKDGTRTRITPEGALGDDRGHSTRSVAVAPDGRHFYVGIGSRGNVGEEAAPRATIREFAMDGGGGRTFASGLRNPVGLAFAHGGLWAVVNERDGLGDELVPDYLTRVTEGGFYGWPYSYIGKNPQPGLAHKAPDKVRSAMVPDLLFRSHSAPLGLAFLDGDAYVGLHGSWNRSEPAGYFVALVPFRDGKPTGEYQVFASGFLVSDRAVWGRPVGIAASPDGALYVADDAGRTVWKVERVK